MGSLPFKFGIQYYEVRKSAYLTSTTIEENVRKLHYFADVFKELYDQKKVMNIDPRHISEMDMESFLGYMKQRKLQNVTKKKYLSLLDSYLGFFGNHVIADMKKQDKFINLQKGKKHEIEFIEENDLNTIFTFINKYPGYNGIIVRGYYALLFGIAGRPKEAIGGLVRDIDLTRDLFYVRHPKGENSWGRMEWVEIIRKDMVPIIEKFLIERAEYLEGRNCVSEYLFVNPNTGEPYSSNKMRLLKKKISIELGIDFKIKDFRSTYATITYKYNPEAKEAISKQMRHEDSATTDEYYISYDNREAAKRLKDEWKKSAIKTN